MDAQTANKTSTVQPQAATEMNVMNAQNAPSKQCKKAERMRGGGAAKSCFMDAIECFICFECCRGLCDCFGDIICCPCEMCC